MTRSVRACSIEALPRARNPPVAAPVERRRRPAPGCLQRPMQVKDHMYDSRIVDIKFHSTINGGGGGQHVISSDRHIIKVCGGGGARGGGR